MTQAESPAQNGLQRGGSAHLIFLWTMPDTQGIKQILYRQLCREPETPPNARVDHTALRNLRTVLWSGTAETLIFDVSGAEYIDRFVLSHN